MVLVDSIDRDAEMPQPPAPMPLSAADYDLIEAAVMETGRGRWFLAEYARRNRHSDTMTLLGAIDRLEAAIRGERAAQSVDRLRSDLFEMAKAIARTKDEVAAIKPEVEEPGKFAEVTAELDSIVQTTETATSDILAAAEQVQEVAWILREQGIDPEVCDLRRPTSTSPARSRISPVSAPAR
jgi:chemotaxis protein CheZ